MDKYNPAKIEKKWQKYWNANGTYKNYDRPKKFYVLDMFPYPSGAGLHVGHPKGYIATDIVARYKMLQGYSVLHPMGWDSFGLPAENYAIKMKMHPRIAVEKNIKVFKKQLEMFGFTYDWDREITTSDPNYFKWTQWIFLKLFEKGLAYESNEPVNWCPSCKTVLSNEDLEQGLCERCGSQVIQRRLRQWVLKMTDYAERLLNDLDSPELEWESQIVEQQKNWIGKSEGVEFSMKVAGTEESISVYTTRIDTVFGMTYAVVAPEHPIIKNQESRIKNHAEVEKYLIEAQNKSNLERTELQKEKTGVELKGIKVINPFNNQELPLFVADYVLGSYGTGAVMAVPAHDERDFEFANKYKLEIKESISGGNIAEKAFCEDGVVTNSGAYNNLTSEEARQKMTEWLKKEGIGKRKINYKMRDWIFSRQKYWGEPIPIVHCEKCGTVALPEDQLPLRLPDVKSYEPTETGESPLANISDWVNTTCPKCKGPAKRETNTMPQWAGSSWYYLRYIDPKNNQALVDKEKEKEWMPVDLYVGGIEHATRHLLYARFWHKFLFDIGVVSTSEPIKRMIHVGLIMAEDGRKMSKRWNNVINPDEVIGEFGADSMRMYEMFMGPFTQSCAWSTSGVSGVRRFLEKIWRISEAVIGKETGKPSCLRNTNKVIKKVGEDIESFKFNTAVSALMEYVNYLDVAQREKNTVSEEVISNLAKIISPFAPHLAEELWNKLGNEKSIFLEAWPEYDPKLIQDEEIVMAVQVNGKLRDTLKVPADISEEDLKKLVLESEKVKAHLAGKEIRKVVFVKGRLINFVVSN